MNRRLLFCLSASVLCLVVWFAFPSIAEWTADRVPYSAMLLLPGGSPFLATLTIIWAIALITFRQLGLLARGITILLPLITGGLLAAGWIYVIGYWLLIALRGGV